MERIYLDHAASTPLAPPVIKNWHSLHQIYGNPSSTHEEGRALRSTLDRTRITCAQWVGSTMQDIIFTSGGTESLFLGIIGTILARKKAGIASPTIVLSPLVHASVWGAVHFAERYFDAQVVQIPCQKDGQLDISFFDDKKNTRADMVIIEHGNSEIGVVQNVREIFDRIKASSSQTVCLADTCGSALSCDIALTTLSADLISISGEKIGAGAGIGFLARRTGIRLEPILHGSQEWGLRAGTENIIGISTLSTAVEHHQSQFSKLQSHFRALHKQATTYIQTHLPKCQILCSGTEHALTNVVHMILDRGRSDLFVQQCDRQGLALSAGSACSSGSTSGSKILQQLGQSPEACMRGIRMSFGMVTTPQELNAGLSILQSVYEAGAF